MNSAVLAGASRNRVLHRIALGISVRIWFAVLFVGQLLFAFYILSYYGGAAAYGDLSRWNRNLAQGYSGDHPMGNAMLAGHLLFAALITIGGPLQLIPALRARYPVFHRWLGRSYILAAFTLAVTGLYLILSGRKVVGDSVQHAGFVIDALVILLCATMALRYALVRDFTTHRRWALRLFLVVSSAWFYRIGLFFWLLVSGGPLGFDPVTFTGPFLTFLSFGQFLVPLLGLEIYLRVQNGDRLARRIAVASGFLVLTLAMVVGITATATGLWLPRIKAGLDSRASIAGLLLVTINSSGVDAALTQYHQLKTQHSKDYNFDEKELNALGYQMIRADQFAAAERILQLNVDAYPQSSNTYDSLAEAYMDDGKTSEAIGNYRRSLELNSDNQGATKALAKLLGH
jgi:hypothetical protein